MSEARSDPARSGSWWLVVPVVGVVGVIGLGLWLAQVGMVSASGRDPLVERPAPVATAPAQPVIEGTAQPAALGTSDLVDAQWAAGVGRATGIPTRAVLAYAGASLTLATEDPSCGLGWNTLAAIGSIETAHGTHGGGVLLASGVVSPPLFGPTLDGVEFDEVPDSDGGSLDGDARWDRAMGPLQFIPDTWVRWGADADGDGIANPQQIDDAALTAARYLCHAGSMTDASHWRAAILSYNHTEAYVDRVAEVAAGYTAAAAGVSR